MKKIIIKSLNKNEMSLVFGGFNIKQELKNFAGGAADVLVDTGNYLDKQSGSPRQIPVPNGIFDPTKFKNISCTLDYSNCSGTLVNGEVFDNVDFRTEKK